MHNENNAQRTHSSAQTDDLHRERMSKLFNSVVFLSGVPLAFWVLVVVTGVVATAASHSSNLDYAMSGLGSAFYVGALLYPVVYFVALIISKIGFRKGNYVLAISVSAIPLLQCIVLLGVFFAMRSLPV